MYIQLEQEDYDAIAELIAESEDGYSLCVEYGECCIEILFEKEISWHQENDYYNGTGAYVVDNVEFGLHDIRCGEIKVKYDDDKLRSTINKYLWDE